MQDLYYFHIVEDGAVISDEEGMLLSRQGACTELRDSARELTSARMRGGLGPGNGMVTLMDDEGHVLETLRFRQVLN